MTHSINNGTLIIQLPQRIDTAVAYKTEEELSTICSSNPHKTVILDASAMTFISSSGLRIILALAKREKDLRVENVSNDVYNVFEMTGFLRIMNVERALRSVSIEGCQEIGHGGVGTVYRFTPETIIKVFREGTPLDDVRDEIRISKEAFLLGMPTAISFETVKVGNQFGLIHELLDAKTLSVAINEDIEHAEDYGHKLGLLMRSIHSIVVDSDKIPTAREKTMRQLDIISRYFSDKEIGVLRRIYEAIPQGNRLLHFDLHTKNVMMVNGELTLIDMGEVCSGNPIEDLSHTYSSMRGLVGDYMNILGMPEDVARRVFDSAMDAYFEGTGKERLAHVMDMIRVASYVRNFTWLALLDSVPDSLQEYCRRVMKERVMNQLDDINNVIEAQGNLTISL